MLHPEQLCHSFFKKQFYLLILAVAGLRHSKGFSLVAVRGELATLH